MRLMRTPTCRMGSPVNRPKLVPPLSQGGPGFPASPIRCPRFQSNEEARVAEGSVQTGHRTVPPRIRKGIRTPPGSMRKPSMWKCQTRCFKAGAEAGPSTRSRSPRQARKATSGGSSDGSQPGCGVPKALNLKRGVPKAQKLLIFTILCVCHIALSQLEWSVVPLSTVQ